MISLPDKAAIIRALQSALPDAPEPQLDALADILTGERDPSEARLTEGGPGSLLQSLAGSTLSLGGGAIQFGSGNQFGDVTFRDVAGGDILHINIAPTITSAEQAYQVAGLPNPYLGLRAFTYADRQRFAGRDELIAHAIALLTAPGAQRTLLFITGASGSGKSSLAQAGIVPALEAVYTARDLPTRRAVIRPGAQPLAALAAALDMLAWPPGGAFVAADQFRLTSPGAPAGPPPIGLLVLDQIEELFRAEVDLAQCESVIALISALPPFAELRLHIIATMRADFLPDLFEHPALYRLAKEGVDLYAMDEARLGEAIRRPVQVQQPGKRLEPALADRLAQDAARDAALLPLLQMTLEDLWRRGSMRLAHYGQLTDALRDRADAVMDYADHGEARQHRRPDGDREAIIAICLDLVAVSLDDDPRHDVRRRQSRAALTGGGAAGEQRGRLIDELCAARMLVADVEQAEGREVEVIDLIHESLITRWPRLGAAIAERRAILQQRERFSLALAEWQGQKQSDMYLLAGVRLAEAESLYERDDIILAQLGAKAFYTRSLRRRNEERQRQLRRAWLFAGGLAILLLIALAAGGWALDRSGEATRQATEKARQLLVSDAQTLLERDPNQALALLLAVPRAEHIEQQEPLLLTQAVHQSAISRIDSSTSIVWSVAFSPDGTQALAGSYDGTLQLWDIATKNAIRRFTGHTDWVNSVAFSPDGALALSGSDDRTLRLWDVASGQLIHTFSGHTDSVNSVTFSPDGQTVLSGSTDRTLRLWEITSGQLIRTFRGHTDRVRSVAFSPDGQTVLSGSEDRTLRLWDVATGQTIHTFRGHTESVNSVAFSPDGATALSGSSDGTLRLWDVASGQPIRTFSGHTDKVRSVAFSPDGALALSGAGDSTLRLWNVASGQPIRTFSGHTNTVASVAFSPDGTLALSGSGDSTLRLWDVGAGLPARTLSGHTNTVYSVAFSPDGKTALSGSYDGTLRLWDVASGQSLRTFHGHTDFVLGVAFSPDGQTALSGSLDETLRLWDVASGQTIRTFNGHTGAVLSVAFSPDGKTALSGSYDGTLRLWDVTTGQTIRTFSGYGGAVYSVAFSPDGTQALSGLGNLTLRLWDVASGQLIRTFSGHTDRVSSVAFSPDGTLALSGSNDRTLRLWDVASGQTIRTFTGHTDSVYSVAFSPDGTLALSGSQDHTLRLWDVATGQTLHIFLSHTNGIAGVAFSPDGTLALSGSGDQTLRLWKIETDTNLLAWIPEHRYLPALTDAQRQRYLLPAEP